MKIFGRDFTLPGSSRFAVKAVAGLIFFNLALIYLCFLFYMYKVRAEIVSTEANKTITYYKRYINQAMKSSAINWTQEPFWTYLGSSVLKKKPVLFDCSLCESLIVVTQKILWLALLLVCCLLFVILFDRSPYNWIILLLKYVTWTIHWTSRILEDLIIKAEGHPSSSGSTDINHQFCRQNLRSLRHSSSITSKDSNSQIIDESLVTLVIASRIFSPVACDSSSFSALKSNLENTTPLRDYLLNFCSSNVLHPLVGISKLLGMYPKTPSGSQELTPTGSTVIKSCFKDVTSSDTNLKINGQMNWGSSNTSLTETVTWENNGTTKKLCTFDMKNLSLDSDSQSTITEFLKMINANLENTCKLGFLALIWVNIAMLRLTSYFVFVILSSLLGRTVPLVCDCSVLKIIFQFIRSRFLYCVGIIGGLLYGQLLCCTSEEAFFNRLVERSGTGILTDSKLYLNYNKFLRTYGLLKLGHRGSPISTSFVLESGPNLQLHRMVSQKIYSPKKFFTNMTKPITLVTQNGKTNVTTLAELSLLSYFVLIRPNDLTQTSKGMYLNLEILRQVAKTTFGADLPELDFVVPSYYYSVKVLLGPTNASSYLSYYSYDSRQQVAPSSYFLVDYSKYELDREIDRELYHIGVLGEPITRNDDMKQVDLVIS